MSVLILTNQIGYQLVGLKRALIRAPRAAELGRFQLKRGASVALEGLLQPAGTVDRWRDWHFWVADFSACQTAGSYTLAILHQGEWIEQTGIEIQPQWWVKDTAHAILDYFESQHCSGRFEEADHSIGFVGGRSDRVDVHGGWYDACGDMSKYLSHLSYANFMNPQQTPLVVWALLESLVRLEKAAYVDAELSRKIRAEATHGADFLVRMQDPAGYFYMTVFDKWSKNVEEREICAYKTQQGIKLDSYQAGFRQGGGVAIAALARAASANLQGDYSAARYLETAESAFAHLEQHNLAYLDDGQENIIDDYCALLAAAELYRATHHERYRDAARRRARALMARLTSDTAFKDWWRADSEGQRPFFHAAEAGLPIVALLAWHELETDAAYKQEIQKATRASLAFELRVTFEVNNPFMYPRQYVKAVAEPPRSAFFFPHQNESGYWWQGENARLGSLAAAAGAYLEAFGPDPQPPADDDADADAPPSPALSHDDDNEFIEHLKRYAAAPIHWILGLNPFDSCMIFGRGRNNLDYEPLWPNAPGGICNGVTGGFKDERDIEFGIPGIGGEHSWRWGEQWIPHAAWYLLAITTLSHPRAA